MWCSCWRSARGTRPHSRPGYATHRAAWQGPLAEQLSTPEVRAHIDAERVAWIEGRLRVYHDNLAALAEATALNKAERNWHPHRDVKGLARHLGRLDDYLQLYAPLSGMSVHAADPETHLVIEDNGAVHIKALATTEPHPVTTSVNLLASLLVRFLQRFRDEWALEDTPVDLLLDAAAMRFIGPGDGTIPAELRPEEWATAIRVTRAPLAEILEEAVQLVLVVVGRAPDGLTEAEIRDVTGLDAIPFGERGHALLRGLLDQLVDLGQLRLDTAVKPHHFHVR